MIDCYIHTSADVFQPSQVLFVKSSNCNVNLNQTLYSITGNRLNEGFSDTCKYYISDSVLWVLYLLSEIIITPLYCLIIISVHSKSTYFHLFNFQHILLSSVVNQNVILSIFKSC